MSEWTPEELEAAKRRNPDLAERNLETSDLSAEYFRMTNPKPTKYHAKRTPEKELEQFVHDTAKACGLLYYHTYRSRYSEPGFPDCIIIGKWMLVAELKDTGKMLTPAQKKWLDAFKELNIIDTHIWRPEDKDEIVKTLQSMR